MSNVVAKIVRGWVRKRAKHGFVFVNSAAVDAGSLASIHEVWIQHNQADYGHIDIARKRAWFAEHNPHNAELRSALVANGFRIDRTKFVMGLPDVTTQLVGQVRRYEGTYVCPHTGQTLPLEVVGGERFNSAAGYMIDMQAKPRWNKKTQSASHKGTFHANAGSASGDAVPRKIKIKRS